MSNDAIPARSDILVIGGGVMGTSIAYFLTTMTDRSVTLLEKSQLASGSTGDSSAILRHHYGEETIYTEMAWWSHQFYERFSEELDAGLSYQNAPLVRFADAAGDSGAYARAGYEALHDREIPVSEYTGGDIASQYPMFEVADRYDLAVSDDAAAFSDGTDAALGFARGARENGARIITGVEVQSLEADDGQITGVETDQGTIDCETVIVAAGPWTPKLAETVGIEVPIETVREQVVLLDPPAYYTDAYPSPTPTTSFPGGEWYIRSDFGDGILVATHRYTDQADPDDYDNTPDEETILELVDELGEHVPDLRDAGIKGQYCGIYSVTPDHDFVIDQAGPAGCYLCCGFSGHGFKHGPAVGKITADLVLEGDTDLVDLEYFALERFEEHPEGNGAPLDNI
ncbi:NAD(P)/FAD-dependent oxidoreductase [Natronosalvus vescus]|uniref:NAD(P)/FAD-dependent oxidoreductase n=1 Tax=Natronosalvus vescus TaxID=2953881 RepID=UPI0020914924|nr:FAD-binding oxidoreductase [Natronosalvus vescus]